MNLLLFSGFVLLTGMAGLLGIASFSDFSAFHSALLAWLVSALLSISGYSMNYYSLKLPDRSFMVLFVGGFLFRFILAGIAVVLLYPLIEHSVFTFAFCFAGYYFLYMTIEIAMLLRRQREKKKINLYRIFS